MRVDAQFTRNIALAASLVAVLPFLIDFLSSFHWLLTDATTTPGWVRAVRGWSIWLATIAVFTWFGATHRGRVMLSTAAVVILAWILWALMGIASLFLISLVADTVEIWQPPRLLGLGLTAVRAAIGVTLGVALRARASRGETLVSAGGSLD